MADWKNMVDIAAAFRFPGDIFAVKDHFGDGHINSTYLLTMKEEDATLRKYIVQRFNRHAFPRPDLVMDNSTRVTRFLHDKILHDGGDPYRETLHFCTAAEGKPYAIDTEGEYWRAYHFIDDALSLQLINEPGDFYTVAKTFALFNRRLVDFPAETLHETIENFHNTPVRFGRFVKAVQEDKLGRAAGCRREIEFILEREKDCHYLLLRQQRGELPVRVTHNDTKLNNVLLDAETGDGVCVIDLDTVMPGLMAYDFGDSIRFGASTALEDEPDLSKVQLSLELFSAYTEGYMEVLADLLSPAEEQSLIWGAKLMTLEVGMRFLTDYLEGDVYFRIDETRPEHNLERSRTQLKLVQEMETHWAELERIMNRCRLHA